MNKDQKQIKISKGLLIALVVFFILPGYYALFIGFNELYSSEIKAREYISIEGTLTSYEEICDSDGCSYSATYTYTVDNLEYSIRSRIMHNYRPEVGNIIDVRYNPTNPKEAIIANDSATPFLLFFGFFFVGIPTFCILASVLDREGKSFNILLGLFFIIMGSGTIIFLGFSEHNPFSIMTALKSSGFLIIIPIAFLILGLYQMIWAIITPPEKMAEMVDRAYRFHYAEDITELSDNLDILNKYNKRKD